MRITVFWFPLPHEPGAGVFNYTIQFQRLVRAYIDANYEGQSLMRDEKLNIPVAEKTAQNAFVLVYAATYTDIGMGATTSTEQAAEQVLNRIYRDLDVLTNEILKSAIPRDWRARK